MSSLSIIVASSGRPTLARTLESAHSQMHDGDEILVSIQSDCPWGHAARNQLMRSARGDALCFIDDDDCYTHGALDAIRAAFDVESAVHIFRMAYPGGSLLWGDREVRLGNVSTQMVVVPNAEPYGVWDEGLYEGDYHFIKSSCQDRNVRWHEDVISLVRPD